MKRAAREPAYATALNFWILNNYSDDSSYWAYPTGSSSEKSTKASERALVHLSMLQAAQNRRIVEQNDRIIALLEQLAKKK